MAVCVLRQFRAEVAVCGCQPSARAPLGYVVCRCAHHMEIANNVVALPWHSVLAPSEAATCFVSSAAAQRPSL